LLLLYPVETLAIYVQRVTQNWSFFPLNYKHYVMIRGLVIISVRERKFLETKVSGNESSQERKFQGTKFPEDESFTYGTFVPGNESSQV